MKKLNDSENIPKFVSYDISKLSKEKGFDDPCFGLYFEVDRFWLKNDNMFLPSENTESRIASPLHSQIIDWLREKHEIFIYVDFIQYNHDNKWTGWYILNYKTETTQNQTDSYKTYYEALNKAIEESLKLI